MRPEPPLRCEVTIYISGHVPFFFYDLFIYWIIWRVAPW